MKQAVLLAAGPIPHPENLEIPQDAFLACADAGYRYAQALGREPDLILGDFDSAPPPNSPAKRLTFPVENDGLDLTFTIQANVVNAVTNEVGTQEVRIGKTHIVKTVHFELTNGIITTCEAEPWAEG